MTRKEQLERSLIYTPRDREELQTAKESLAYDLKVGDLRFAALHIQQIRQGEEYLKLTGDKHE